MREEEKIARLRLSRSASVGPIVYKQLLELYGTAERAIELVPERAKKLGNKKFQLANIQTVYHEWQTLHKLGGDFLFYGAADYPKALAAIADPPPVLAYLGRNLHCLSQPTVGMVGSRNPSINAYDFARGMCYELARSGIVSVSGLARGIDTACHTGSIEYETGSSVAVLASGVDVCYPRQNQGLYDRLRNEGVIVSESVCGTQPVSHAFPRRNRIISGLSLAVVVIEARARSGTLITARHALEQGRDVLAVPSTPLDERAQGCLTLLKQGAQLCTCAEDVLQSIEHVTIPFRQSIDKSESPVTPRVEELDLVNNAVHEQILSLLGPTPVNFSRICSHIEEPTAHVRAALLDHEIIGNIIRVSGDNYVLAYK